MPNLYAFGAQAINYYSKCGICSTTDLTSFVPVSAPNLPYTHLLSATRSPSGAWCMSTNSGGAVRTSNLVDYYSYDLSNKQWQFNKVLYSTQFVAVGFVRTLENLEQATLFISDSAFDEYSWQARFAVFDTYSAFTDVCNTSAGNMVAVGYANKLQTSLMIVGSVSGRWEQIQLPEHIQGGVWSVSSDGTHIWVGGRGWIAVAPLTNLSNWIRIDLGTSDTVTQIVNANGLTAAVAGDRVFYSTNGVDYDNILIPGHELTCVHAYNSKIIIGGHSMLTQTDMWVFDPVSKQVDPKKTGIHAYSFVMV